MYIPLLLKVVQVFANRAENLQLSVFLALPAYCAEQHVHMGVYPSFCSTVGLQQ